MLPSREPAVVCRRARCVLPRAPAEADAALRPARVDVLDHNCVAADHLHHLAHKGVAQLGLAGVLCVAQAAAAATARQCVCQMSGHSGDCYGACTSCAVDACRCNGCIEIHVWRHERHLLLQGPQLSSYVCR